MFYFKVKCYSLKIYETFLKRVKDLRRNRCIMKIPEFNKMFGTKIEIDQTYMEELEEERAWKKWQDGSF